MTTAPRDLSNSSKLDLGIADLVAGGAESADSQQQFKLQSVATSTSNLGDSNVTSEILISKSQYQELAEAHSWQAIVDTCESRINKDFELAPSDVGLLESQLWWVKAQYELGNLPMQILAAPLDKAAQSLIELGADQQVASPNLRRLALQLLNQVSEKLDHLSDKELALSLLEKAARIDHQQQAKYIAATNQHIQALKSAATFEYDSKSKQTVAKFESLIEKLGDNITTVQEPGKGQLAPKASVQDLKSTCPKTKNILIVILSSIACLLVLLITWQIYNNFFSSISVDITATEEVRLPSNVPKLLLPTLKRIENLSSLDAIFYDLNTTALSTSITESAQKIEQSVVAPASTANQNASAKELAKINTKAPLEPKEFEMLRQGQLQEESPENLQNDSQDSDRLFGSPKPKFDQLPINKPGANEVKKFDKERIYTVLSRTKIMARPAFATVSMGQLEPGDKVKVDQTVGSWLRLRSKRGGYGYILAQDAELIRDPSGLSSTRLP